jgi:hypothetical protein
MGQTRCVFRARARLLIAALVLIAAKLPAQSMISSRFRDPDGITADPTGLRRDTTVRVSPPGPRIPRGKEGITATPVVAYVIDTTGRVELETASFLTFSPAEFIDAVCAFLPKQRFEPFLVADRKSRVLLVQLFGFTNWKHFDRAKIDAAQALVTQSQEEFSTSPISKVVARLDPLPHFGGTH